MLLREDSQRWQQCFAQLFAITAAFRCALVTGFTERASKSKHNSRQTQSLPVEMRTEYGTAINANGDFSEKLAAKLVYVWLVFLALLLFSAAALAGPPAGTVIPNTANGTAVLLGNPIILPTSNTVQVTVQGSATGATLTLNQTVNSFPGTTLTFPHTLTNGTTADTYALSTLDLPGGFNFTSLTILPDANGDGIPDSLVPIATSGALAVGQVFRFVVVAVVPAGAAIGSSDQFRISANAPSLGGTPLVNIDTVNVQAPPAPADPCALLISKTISQISGPSPAGPLVVRIAYNNPSCADGTKTSVNLRDALTTGFEYVAGSGKWGYVSTPLEIALTDVAGDQQTGSQGVISYEAGSGLVNATISSIAPGQGGYVSFQVNIAAGLPVATSLDNTATASGSALNGPFVIRSNRVSYVVTGRLGVRLVGQTLGPVTPGEVVLFKNVVTNIGDIPDTYNVTLGTSNYPAGTTFQLFKADGVTPLADSNGDGIPDTGVLVPGASIDVIVRVRLPATAVGGPFSIQKTARSIAASSVFSTDLDRVTALAKSCRIIMDPDHTGKVGVGRLITYPHVITNMGNCDETVTFPGVFKTDSRTTWSSEVYLDEGMNNKSSTAAKVAGLVDGNDVLVTETTNFILRPGQSQRILVRVRASMNAAPTDQNITIVLAVSTSNTDLKITDITSIDSDGIGAIDNDIRNYTDIRRLVPTVWAFVGTPLYLRANATSCNQLPAVVESRTVVITGPNGEQETVTAIETGPNTSIFEVVPFPTRRPPVSAENGFLEGLPGDTFDVSLLGCGRRIATTVTLIDPAGIVFDSNSNEPISGAVVRLVLATGGSCTNTAAVVQTMNSATGQLAASANPVTTGADGRFQFPVISQGQYCVIVTPPNGYSFASAVPFTALPAGRNILAVGPTSGPSYGGTFSISSATGSVAMDIPVDPSAVTGLFVQKSVQREVVELGDSLDYTVKVRNQAGVALNRADVQVVDALPPGFSFVKGTARLGGQPIADPVGQVGPLLTFNAGRLAGSQEVTLTYRVRVGPGALQGDGINRVFATYTVAGVETQSNVATARVRVQGGVFSEKAYLIGKIYADCNANGTQDAGEVGVPGVRFFLEDGTSVISDSEGKYSLYGLTAKTRVFKADPSTLPAGAKLSLMGNRSAGKSGTRFLDLKNGELHRADFAIEGCANGIDAEVSARRKVARDTNIEIEGRLQQKLETDTRASQISDPRALPASGTLGNTQGGNTSSIAPLDTAAQKPATATAQTALPTATIMELAAARQSTLGPRTVKVLAIPLEVLIQDADNTLAFIGLKDGDRLPYAQTTIQVKGVEGTRFALSINGVDLTADRVGKRTSVPEKKLQAWEFVGVDLKAGANQLKLTQFDSFGNERGVLAISVVAPDKLGKLLVDLPKGGAVADGRTPAKIVVRLTDDKGVPVTVRTPISLETTSGVWKVEDLDPREQGTQTFIEGGTATFDLLPPAQPGNANIRVSSGIIETEIKLDFMPDLRDLIAAGVIEGVLNLRKLSANAMQPTRSQDGFEQELTHFSRSSNDGKRDTSARAAFFLKGKVKGEYLLTMAYDSDKDGRERLFRDIQPDEFYPVYGDASSRGFDAQSTQRFYVRVDKQKSWLLYGDFTTNSDGNSRRLANYNRSLTGAKAHYEEGKVSANVFASRDSTRQDIEEIRANGTSGPYTLSSNKGLINSEKVEVLTRDRNQPSLVLKAVAQSRFSDYEIEPFTGRILFRAPVASLDADLNPISIRVTYEVDQGGAEFWVAGGDVNVKVTDRIEVGATFVKDRNPVEPFEMRGINATVKLAERTLLTGEFAQTEKPLGNLNAGGITAGSTAAGNGPQKGNAQRVELKHRTDKLDVEVYAGRSDAGFDNAAASISRGREEAGVKANIRIDAKTTVKVEALHTGDRTTNASRQGIQASVERSLENGLRVEAAVRHAKETTTAALPTFPNDLNAGSTGTTPNEVTSIRGRVTGPMPGLKDATVYGELEVDVKDSDRKVAAVGGEYLLPNKGRVYARHEFISSLTGPYGLNSSQRQNSTVFGVDTEYMKDGKVFSEYRIRDAISGGDAEAAFGLRNLWTLGEGLKLGTGFERIQALSGKGDAESTAITLGLEYTRNPLWKGTARLELRDGATSDSILSTLGIASKLNRDWTFLGRNTFSLTRNQGTSAGEILQDRFQAGVAYRQTDSNEWSGLARVELKVEKDTTQPGMELKRSVEILSLHANYQPRRPFTLSGRYAAKIASEKSNGLVSKSNAQLVAGRATWEFAPRFDFSINASTLLGQGAQKRQHGLGFELGYMVSDNLWLSGGYNVFGFRDDDLVSGDHTTKGAFVRLRYKFDEELFDRSGQSKDAPSQPSRKP